MKDLRVAFVWMAGIAVFSVNLLGQTTPKPSPYTGISQPPPDDTIVSDAGTTAPPPAKLVARPVARPTAPPAPAATAAIPSVQPKCDPDDRIVGDPSPCGAAANGQAQPKPADDPDAGIVTFVPSRSGELPEGTTIRVSLDQDLRTGTTEAGSDFTGRVAADVVFSGRVVIPQGSQVIGKVVRATEGRHFGGSATIRIRPDVVVLPDGSRYVLRAQVITASGKSRVDGEGALKPLSRVKTNIIKETAGIGTGAVAGALIGGGPGALVGSLIGAGVMTTNILAQHPASIDVPRDSTLTLSLTQAMSIAPAPQIN